MASWESIAKKVKYDTFPQDVKTGDYVTAYNIFNGPKVQAIDICVTDVMPHFHIPEATFIRGVALSEGIKTKYWAFVFYNQPWNNIQRHRELETQRCKDGIIDFYRKLSENQNAPI